MPQQPLQWLFELFDKTSAPATKVASSVDRVTKSFDQAREASAKWEAAQEHAGGASGGFALKLHAVIEIAARAIQVVEGLTSRVYGLGKEMVLTAGAAEKSGLAFEIMLGKATAAQHFNLFSKFEKKTAFSGAEARSMALPLERSGFDRTGIKQALFAASDIEAVGGDPRVFLEAVRKVKNTGRIESEALGQLGVDVSKFFDKLSVLTGTSRKSVQQKLTQGAFGGDTILQAVYQAIEERQGGALGTGGEQAAQTLPGLLKRIENLPGRYFETLNTSEGYGQFKGFLSNILSLLDPTSEFGKTALMKMTGVFNKVFKKLFGDFGSEGGKARLAEVFDGILEAVDKVLNIIVDGMPTALQVLDAFEAFWPTLRVIIAGVSMVFEGWGLIVNSVVDAFKVFISWGDQLGDVIYDFTLAWEAGANKLMEWSPIAWLHETAANAVDAAARIGTNIVQGIIDGISSMASYLKDSVVGLSGKIEGWVREKLGIQSPSRVMERLGRYTAEGFAVGLDKSAPRIDGAFAAAFAIDDVAAGSPFAAGQALGRGAVIVNLHGGINVTLGDGATPAEAGQQAARDFRDALIDELELWELEGA